MDIRLELKEPYLYGKEDEDWEGEDELGEYDEAAAVSERCAYLIATQTGQPIDVVALEVNKLITSLMPRFTADELREKLEEKENSQPTITGEKVEQMLEIHAKQRLLIKGTGTGATPYNLTTQERCKVFGCLDVCDRPEREC